MSTLQQKIKQTYFYMDYLRMHANGRELQLFKKNRHMLEPELADDPKKGYKAFVQRIFKTLLDNEFASYLPIVKPRNSFGYNVGPREEELNGSGPQASPYRAIDVMNGDYEKLLYIYRRNLLYGEFQSQINNYLTALQNAECIQPRGRKFFFKIRLDEEKSKGWETIQAVRAIKQAHKEMIDAIDPIESLKLSFKYFSDRIIKVQEGQTVFKSNPQKPIIDPTHSYKVVQASVTTDTLGYVQQVDMRVERLRTDGTPDPRGRQERILRSQIIPEYSENNAEIASTVGALRDLIEGFKEHWVQLAIGSAGLDIMTLGPLAVSSYTRDLNAIDQSYIRGLDFHGEHQDIFTDVCDRYDARRNENGSNDSAARRERAERARPRVARRRE